MLNTVLDINILSDFIKNQPQPIPLGSESENEYWLSFWQYLKSHTDLTITGDIDLSNLYSTFIRTLTTGRKGSIVNYTESFKTPSKFKLAKKYYPHSVFFIDESDENNQNYYRERNGLHFGFKKDYNTSWKSISLYGSTQTITVAGEEGSFSSWSDLNNYIVPFSDLVVFDDYIFKELELLDYNLVELIKVFSQRTPIKFNLLIFSNAEQTNRKGLDQIYNILEDKIRNHGINCNLGIVLTPFQLRIHDRGIITNYLRVSCQNSFNFFNSRSELIVRQTELSLNSLTDRNSWLDCQIRLKQLSDIVESLSLKDNKDKYLIGHINNRLIKNGKQ